MVSKAVRATKATEESVCLSAIKVSGASFSSVETCSVPRSFFAFAQRSVALCQFSIAIRESSLCSNTNLLYSENCLVSSSVNNIPDGRKPFVAFTSRSCSAFLRFFSTRLQTSQHCLNFVDLTTKFCRRAIAASRKPRTARCINSLTRATSSGCELSTSLTSKALFRAVYSKSSAVPVKVAARSEGLFSVSTYSKYLNDDLR
mmetsp:Transcript_1707/g.2687  ORF Transcript_1707/g.2687 Transcript_1707/m.2687 type:complete len:202 (+) Transcript_1707:410-1015(+)